MRAWEVGGEHRRVHQSIRTQVKSREEWRELFLLESKIDTAEKYDFFFASRKDGGDLILPNSRGRGTIAWSYIRDCCYTEDQQ